MQRTFSIVLLFSFIYSLSPGQTVPTVLSLQKNDRRKGTYLFEKKAYFEAIPVLETALRTAPKNTALRYRLGMAYYHTRSYAKAEKELLKVLSLQLEDEQRKNDYPLLPYYLAKAQHYQGKYEEAKSHYMNIIRSKAGIDRTLKREATNAIRNCDFALQTLEEQYVQPYEVRRLPGKLNTAYSEFAPAYVMSNAMVYTSMHSDSLLFDRTENGERKLTKLYQSELQNGVPTEPQLLDELNDDFYHTANASFTQDGKTVYFTYCAEDRYDKMRCRIYRSYRQKSGWTKPEKLVHNININGYSSTQPTISTLRKRSKTYEVLYFVSDRPGGRGGMDIWYSAKGREGTFEVPVNCGSALNTQGNEVSPYYDDETGVMYYSSDFHPGLGGLDVFRAGGSRRSWRKPENLGLPVNSSYDDTYFSFSAEEHRGLLVSNRPGGKLLGENTCCEDVFTVIDVPVKHLQILISAKDTLNKSLEVVSVLLIDEGTPQKPPRHIATSDANGIFKFSYIPERNYRLSLSMPGYEKTEMDMDSLLKQGPETDTVRFFLSKVNKTRSLATKKAAISDMGNEIPQKDVPIIRESYEEGKQLHAGDVLVMENVYFRTGKSTLEKTATLELENLKETMLRTIHIKIEISGYTDSQGDEKSNQILSQKRAEAVRDYLINAGIGGERMVAKGYGETNPRADNTTTQGRKQNRRTEIKVLEQ